MAAEAWHQHPADRREMAALVHSADWAATPLGTAETWPQSLRSTVDLVLAHGFPMAVLWGEHLIQIYNDGYRTIMGEEHPVGLGQPARDRWCEAWPVSEPIYQRVLRGETVTLEDQPCPVARHGSPEGAWFTLTYSPVRDDHGSIAGVLVTGIETTAKVKAEAMARESQARLHERSEQARSRNQTEHDRQRRLYEAILTNTPDLAYVFDRDHRFIYANEALLRMWGRTWDKAIGKTCLELGYPDWHAAMHDREIEQVIATKQSIRGEVPFAGAFGHRIYDYIFVPVLDTNGRVEAVAGTTRDVTESRQAETSLRESELRFRIMADAVPQIVWITDAEGRTEFFNRQWSNYTGSPYEPTTAAEVAANFIHPDDAAITMARFEEARRTGGAFLVEHRIRSKTGEYRWFLVRGEPQRDTRTGEITRWFGASVDIHDRKTVEAALQQSEARWRGLFASMQEGVAVCEMVYDAEGRAVDYRHLALNDAWERLTGVPNEAVEGKLVSKAIPGIEPYWLETFARVVETGEPAHFEHYLGVYGRWFEVTAYRTEPGHFAAVFLNVTERKRAEQALRDSETRLRVATEANGIGSWELTIRADQTTTAVTSPGYDAIFGYAAPRPEWTSEIFLSHVLAEDREAVAQRFRDAVERGTAYAFEARIQPHGGAGTRWIEAHGQPVEHDTDGRAVRFIGIVQDITPRKAAEERMQLLAREVDHRAKNALAVVQSVVSLTRAQDVPAFKRAVEGRISALARAQAMLADDRWRGADLRALFEGELAPFHGEGHRVALEGPPVALPPGMAQPLAMAAHELATNALKYGALSVPTGRVTVSWDEDNKLAGTLRLRWVEAGGPPVVGPPERRGFGTRVLDGTIRGQLGGSVSLAWTGTGLVCEMEVPLGHTAASSKTEGTNTSLPSR